VKRLAFLFGLIVFACIPLVSVSQEQIDGPKSFPTGAKPSSFASIIDAIKTGKATVYKARGTIPAKVTPVPPRISYWGNNQFGVCVSSESAFSMASYSVYVGAEEVFIKEADLIAWARQRNYLNGATLLEVINDMQSDGIKDEKGILRKAGQPSSVDYRDENALKSAISIGPVSIAIDSNALPSNASNKNGWFISGSRSYRNTDHCVCLSGYGSSAELFKALGLPVPSGAPANGYFLFTWNSIGVVDHKWLLNTCVEAWVRNPTILNFDPPPPPKPGNIEVACANVVGSVGQSVKFMPLATGGTSPYIFLFDYGDGAKDAAGSHTFNAAGSYKVIVTAVDSLGQVGTAICAAAIGSTPGPGPGPSPAPGGLSVTFPRAVPPGTYQLVAPSDLDELQRRLDAIRGLQQKIEILNK
jgi:hypothetical protein